ncbi:MAG: hypothetical protein MJ016_02405 [Victivallaceae bacterium]|nr:hypothetical protein [Victivallaceae bacterium]
MGFWDVVKKGAEKLVEMRDKQMLYEQMSDDELRRKCDSFGLPGMDKTIIKGILAKRAREARMNDFDDRPYWEKDLALPEEDRMDEDDPEDGLY